MNDMRIEAAAEAIVKNLERGFGHCEERARLLFAEYHKQHRLDAAKSSGWAPADYYDHETPAAIALEIQFHHEFPLLPKRGTEFLEWRKGQWDRVSNKHWFDLIRNSKL